MIIWLKKQGLPAICCNPYFCNAPVASEAAVHCWHSPCQAFQLSEVMGCKHTGLRFNSFSVSFRMDRARGTPPGKEIKCTHTQAHRERRFENIPESAILCSRSTASHERGCRRSWLAQVYFVAIFSSTPSSLPSGMISRASFLRQEVRNVFTMSDLRRRWVSRDSSCFVREEHSKSVPKEYRWDGSARKSLRALCFFFSYTYVKGDSVSLDRSKR